MLGNIAVIIKNNEKLLMNIGLGLLGIGVIILLGSIFMDTTVGTWGVDTQHVYGNNVYVYTRNGRITSWQK